MEGRSQGAPCWTDATDKRQGGWTEQRQSGTLVSTQITHLSHRIHHRQVTQAHGSKQVENLGNMGVGGDSEW